MNPSDLCEVCVTSPPDWIWHPFPSGSKKYFEICDQCRASLIDAGGININFRVKRTLYIVNAVVQIQRREVPKEEKPHSEEKELPF